MTDTECADREREQSVFRSAGPDGNAAGRGRPPIQGSVLALWLAQAPPQSKGFQEKVRLVPNHEKNADHALVWSSPVNIVSWGQLAQVLDKDPLFEFKHCELNICVTSADLSSQRTGDVIWIGEARLEVLRNGGSCPKRCHLQAGDPSPCALTTSWISARVLQAGQVCIDDTLLALAQYQGA